MDSYDRLIGKTLFEMNLLYLDTRNHFEQWKIY